jgi:hypothetical protein
MTDGAAGCGGRPENLHKNRDTNQGAIDTR